MKTNLILSVCGNRETIEIAANSDYEIVFNEIDNALRKLYQISNGRRRYGNQSLIFKASVGENNLIFGIGLSADKSGKIIWEYNIGFDRIDRGASNYSRYVDGAFWYMANMIISRFSLTDEIGEENNETDENEIMEEMDDMYQYASEAAEEIENLADSVDDAYSDIIAEMKNDEPDIEYAMERVDDMYRRLKDIENELKWCLQRCDERTGCNIGWDDFCTADYFEPISIHGDWDCPSYSIAEFINDYNTDAADFMNTLIENIWKALGGQTGDTFRNAIDDLDMPFYIAA